MGPLHVVLLGCSAVLWFFALEATAEPIVCMHCDDVTDLKKCRTETCHGIEDGCYWQVNNENNRIRMHARCISDDTCHHPNTWHGLKTWKGTYLENGCCFGSHYCSTPQYTAAMNKWLHPLQQPNTINHFCTVCEGASSLSECKMHQQCHTGQDECFMQVNRADNGAVQIFAHCTQSGACINMQSETWARSDHFKTDVCQACCTGDDCNNGVCQGQPPNVGAPVTTSAPLVAPHRLSQGIDCMQGSGVTSKCPDAFPYCMNVVENDASGTKLITRKCASESTCQKQWWEDTSGHSICSVLDPAMTYRTTFTCSYCCLTPDCNKDVHPNPLSLFIGTDN